MDSAVLRRKVYADEWSMTTHAFTEARKEGIDPYDIEFVLQTGELIEDYPGRYRCLVSGTMKNKLPLHLVCDYYDFMKHKKEDIVVVTAYIPGRDRWLKDKKRKEGE